MANEKRFIDANAFRDLLYGEKAEWFGSAPYYPEWIISACIDSTPTVDAVEAHEYDAIVNKLECLLCHATGGQYSKAGYSLEDMERMVTDYIEECCEEAVEEAVVHGQWEQVAEADYKCSVCGFRFTAGDSISMFPYCRCGARMDGDQGE